MLETPSPQLPGPDRIPRQGHGPLPESARVPERLAARWLLAFILMQLGCQVALLFQSLAPLRVLFRTGSFGASLALLLVLPGGGPRHPAYRWAVAALLVVVLGFAHPLSNTLLARVAQIGLYVAILAPLFWVPRLQLTPALLRRVLFILWGFHTLSAGVGVLQAYYPGRFQPAVSTAVLGLGEMAGSLKITLANGQLVWRPMGLTDMPGGAAMAGLYAILFGLGFFLSDQRWAVRLPAVGSMGVGLFCIYLSQIRSVLIMAAISVVTYAAVLAWRGELKRLVRLAVVLPVLVLGTFVWAASVGGESMTKRFATLVEDRPDDVYYRNRGIFLEYTFGELLPQYPLGAGLGRWGMMSSYFGDPSDPVSTPLHVEIQWTAWLLDGGVPLIVCYTLALLVTARLAWRLAVANRAGGVGPWAALVLAYDIGALAMTFNYAMFIGQSGLEFWLLNACLFRAAVRPRPRALVPVRGTTAVRRETSSIP